MGKFAIGVRVRDDDGDEGVILDKRKGERLVQHDDPVYGTMWRSKSALTALGVVANDNEVSPCAPVFEKEYSVGDRVRFIRDNPNGGKNYGSTGEEFVVAGTTAPEWDGEGQIKITHPAHGFDPAVPVSAIEPAVAPATGPFAVGDRVRLIENYGSGVAGDEGVVTGFWNETVGREQGVRVEFGGGRERCLYAYRLVSVTPAIAPSTPTFTKGDRALSQNGDYVTVDTDPDAENHVWVSFGTTKWRTPVSWLSKWEPKVGERVRVTSENNIFRVGTPAGCEGTITRVYSGAGVDLDLEHPRDGVIGQTCHDYQRYLEPLPVAEQPAAEPALWAPVAGKYGKTRDGRKARVEKAENCKYPFRAGGNHYNADGSHFYSEANKDLVAEWVEPVAEQEPEVAAEPDATWRLTQAKDGETVRCNHWGGNFFTAGLEYVVENGGLRTNDGEHFSLASVLAGAGQWSIVEPAAPPAKFNLGDRVVYTGTTYPRPCRGTVSRIEADRVYCEDWSEGSRTGFIHEDDLVLVTAPTRGTLATLTTPARVAGQFGDKVNLVFPDLPAGRNSFALPVSVLAAAA